MGRSIARLEDILHVLVDKRTTRRGRPVLVAIDGPGGSGKSTVAATIAPQLPGALVLAKDDFAFGWSGAFAATRPMDRCDFVVDGSSSPPRPFP